MIRRCRFLIATACILAAVGCSGKSSTPGKGAELRVGMDLSYPPFEMQDKSDKKLGLALSRAKVH